MIKVFPTIIITLFKFCICKCFVIGPPFILCPLEMPTLFVSLWSSWVVPSEIEICSSLISFYLSDLGNLFFFTRNFLWISENVSDSRRNLLSSVLVERLHARGSGFKHRIGFIEFFRLNQFNFSVMYSTLWVTTFWTWVTILIIG